MKLFATLICLFLIAGNALAQVNLVANGSFEEHEGCPVWGGVNECINWDATYGSPDYFHICGTQNRDIPQNIIGYQNTIQDSAYIGIGSYIATASGFQEIITGNLTEPLQNGVKYRVRFTVSYADYAKYAVCCIGAILSSSQPPTPPFSQNISDVEFQVDWNLADTATWFEFDEVYTALGGETHIFLGSFRPENEMQITTFNQSANNEVAYFYIDDVEVYEDDLVGIEEEKLQVKLNSELVSEQLEISTDKPVQLRLMDISGRMVLSEQLNSGRSSISVSSIPNGMYVAVFTSESGQTTSRKILKAN